jgi:5-methylcytosine-specific restriction endonuclease McrA
MILFRQFSKKALRSSLPKAVREQIWIRDMGRTFEGKCNVYWCENDINVFDFTIGHNIPVSKGGSNDLTNLRAICARCNCSMSNKFTIDEWNEAFKL